MSSSLLGKTAIVTGAANGIGRAIALGLMEQSANVLAVDLNEQDLAQNLAQNSFLEKLALDVTEAQAPEKIVSSALKRFGQIDFLINNAGIAVAGDFESLSDEQFDHIVAVNVRSMFRLSKAALPSLKKSDQGRIINLGSIMSDMAGPALSIYGMSKHAVAGLTKGMAVDLGKYGITVNYLQPGSIATKMSEPFMEDPDFKAFWEAKTPIGGRLGQPEEVAAAALFLVTKEAGFVSGLGMNVDGGAIVHF